MQEMKVPDPCWAGVGRDVRSAATTTPIHTPVRFRLRRGGGAGAYSGGPMYGANSLDCACCGQVDGLPKGSCRDGSVMAGVWQRGCRIGSAERLSRSVKRSSHTR
ncbi:hypothetical protein GCM10010170_024690 [Dactylosporangium salmoneum]|uniref:Uncharacterized protein n=1 Tax=Dactylosporangium salmoneum TaxID=53361 RepID=A0ABN3G020_9ACTN